MSPKGAKVMNDNNEMLADKEKSNGNRPGKARTTIGIRQATKNRMDDNRAPGQCYDGFIWQLVDLWESTNGKNSSRKQ